MRLKMRHGGHSEPTEQRARGQSSSALQAAPEESLFDYMFADIADDPAAHLPVADTAATIGHLKDLGDRMIVNDPPDEANSHIPPVYTYWGQFIDHDITANTDRDSDDSGIINDITRADFAPLAPDDVRQNLVNLRTPAFDLDSVYGGGPDVDPEMYDGIKLKIGTVATGPGIPGVIPPPDDDLMRDLPRAGQNDDGVSPKEAVIGDMRNDENLIVAQFHLSFLRFHNNAVDWVESQKKYATDTAVFEEAQQLTRKHYQWLVVNDYLRTVMSPGTVDKVLLGGRKFYNPTAGAFAPVEFSVAAYRFGHSMVRDAYDHNRNFGRGGDFQPKASFEDEFRFTGGGGFFGTDVLPFNWIIEWDRFIDKGSVFDKESDGAPARFARKIDTHLAPPLEDMVNQTDPDQPGDSPDVKRIKDLLRHLAQRNLLRGYLLSVPTGQAVANAMDIPVLSAGELQQGNSADLNATLTAGGFLDKTPLWYYVLKEAEVRENGHSLGDVGSRIVVETMIGMMQCDEGSYLNTGWEPSQGVKLQNGDPIVTIGDFLKFAGVLV